MTARAPQEAPGGILLPFTTCRACVRERRALREPWHVCDDCISRIVADARRADREKRTAVLRRLAIEVAIVLAFVGLLVFANVARVFR